MSKAYDRVEREFLRVMMECMGFEKESVGIIMNCITSVSYSAIVNGKRGETFKPTKGLRQGDPRSPSLFLICSKGLSALMRIALHDGLIKGAKASRRGPQVSHLLFANGYILFGEATTNGTQILKGILKEYEMCLARDAAGKVLISKTVHTEARSAFAAEALTCLMAIQAGVEMGLRVVTIEGNSMSVIKKCQTDLVDKSEIGAYIRDVQTKKNRFWSIIFIHAHRSANQLAYILAMETLKNREQAYLVGSVPVYALQRMEIEWAKEPN
ncbi:uncharacterized protein LOC128035466 [Gossypium raimondii]|nr:uncharacterized protein LOC128035466 [Gossypium raimondii]